MESEFPVRNELLDHPALPIQREKGGGARGLPTKSGRIVVFLTIEDETGLIDVTIFQDTYQKYGAELFTSPTLLVEGHVERRGQGVSVTARRVEPMGLWG